MMQRKAWDWSKEFSWEKTANQAMKVVKGKVQLNDRKTTLS